MRLRELWQMQEEINLLMCTEKIGVEFEETIETRNESKSQKV